jgi:hypothetical protein
LIAVVATPANAKPLRAETTPTASPTFIYIIGQ